MLLSQLSPEGGVVNAACSTFQPRDKIWAGLTGIVQFPYTSTPLTSHENRSKSLSQFRHVMQMFIKWLPVGFIRLFS